VPAYTVEDVPPTLASPTTPFYDVFDENPPEIVRRYRAELATTVVEGQTLLAALLWQPSTRARRRAIADVLRRIAPERYLDDDERVTTALRTQSLWEASAVIEAILAEKAVPRKRWRRLRRWGRALCCMANPE
jgi:SOS response regulatory protein OraA/RecX